jgi:hypothetical protein
MEWSKKFEAGLDTMESWEEYTLALEERKLELQRSSEAYADEEENRKNRIHSRKPSLVNHPVKRKLKRRLTKSLSKKPSLNSINDDSGSEAQSSSNDENNLSEEEEDGDEDAEDTTESELQTGSELSLQHAYESNGALDAEIEAEENQLRYHYILMNVQRTRKRASDGRRKA